MLETVPKLQVLDSATIGTQWITFILLNTIKVGTSLRQSTVLNVAAMEPQFVLPKDKIQEILELNLILEI